MVIMNKSDYLEKMFDHLSNSGSYKKLYRNPLKKTLKEVSNSIKSNMELENKELIVSCTSKPRSYGLPKLYKERDPLRSIVNVIRGPTYKLMKHLAKKLKYLGRC